jgi:deoxyhypusine synthase
MMSDARCFVQPCYRRMGKLIACTDFRIILGGGLVKHHTCNANLMRNGAEFSVYINTGQVCGN